MCVDLLFESKIKKRKKNIFFGGPCADPPNASVLSITQPSAKLPRLGYI